MVKIRDLNLYIHRIVCLKKGSNPPHCAKRGKNHSGVCHEGSLVVSSVVTPGISLEIVQIISREMVVGEI